MSTVNPRFRILPVIAVLLVIVAACTPVATPGAEPTDMPAAPKVLTYVLAQEPNVMDPDVAVESQSGLIIRNVYERLIELAPDGETIIPGLAESWDISPDGITYTFHLRQGVTFHSGAPFTAEAARFSLERALTLGKGDSFKMADYIESQNVKVVDDATVEITLTEPYAPILSILASWGVGSVVNPEMVTENATDEDPWAEGYLATHMDGTGPFKFVEWQPKQFVAVERNDDYWKGPAKLDSIIFRLVEEPATVRLMLETGEVDIVHSLPGDMVDALSQNPDVVIAERPGLETTYWAFNSQIEPFTDPLVRQALSYAVDYNAIMDNLVKGGGIRMQGPLPQGVAGFDESVMLYERDVEKAKALLAEAGYPDGLTVVTHYPVWRNLADIAVVLQANFADVGVQLDLQEVPLGTLVELVVTGGSPFFSWVSTPTYADPDAVLYPKFHTDAIAFGASGNVGYYSNPEVDELLNEARTSTDNARRLELYAEVQHIVTDGAAWVFLSQNVIQQPVRGWVEGYEIQVIGIPDFWGVDIVK